MENPLGFLATQESALTVVLLLKALYLLSSPNLSSVPK